MQTQLHALRVGPGPPCLGGVGGEVLVSEMYVRMYERTEHIFGSRGR